MQNPKEQLTKFIDKLTSKIWQLGLRIRILEFFARTFALDGNEKTKQTINEFRYFFFLAQESLQKDLVITLSEIYASDKNSKRSMINFLNLVESNIYSIVGKDTSKEDSNELKKEVSKQLSAIKDRESLIIKLRANRDKYEAHFDKIYFDKPEKISEDFPMSFKEIYELEDLCRQIINWHEKEIFKTSVTMWVGERGCQDLEILISDVSRYKILYESVLEHPKAEDLLKKILAV